MTRSPATPLLIALLLGQIGFGLLAMTICLPSMQEWGAIFGADQARVQLSFSAFVVAMGGMQLVYGPLSDRYGRKRVLLAGLSLACTGSLLAALAPDLPSLIAARVVQGAGAAAGSVTGRALVEDLFGGPRRTQVMAYVGMVMGLSPPLAIVIGGQLHVRLGWQANFVLVAALALLLLVAAWRALPGHVAKPGRPSHWLRAMVDAYARLGREPGFLLHVAIVCMTTATFYAFLGGAPIVLRSYGVGPADIGWYMMVVPLSYIVGSYLASRLIHRIGERRLMRLGQFATVGSLLLLLALGLAGLRTPLAFALPLLLLGLGHGLLVPPTMSGTIGLVPALAGSAAAVAGLTQQWTGALGGYAVGLVPHEGPVNLGLVMLGFSLCALAAQLLLHSRRTRR